METAEEQDNSEYGDAAHCRAALHRPLASSTREDAHCRAALHRFVASSTREDAENTVRASHIRRTANAARTSGAAPLVKGEAEVAARIVR
jgi:hypothetical protein